MGVQLQVRDNLSRSPAWNERRGFHIRPVCWWNQSCACGSTPCNHSPVFLPFQMPLPSPAATAFETATPTECITHYTLQAKSCANGVPFGNPVLSECVATLPPKRKISGCSLLLIHSRIDRLFYFCRSRFLYPLSEYVSCNEYAWNGFKENR